MRTRLEALLASHPPTPPWLTRAQATARAETGGGTHCVQTVQPATLRVPLCRQKDQGARSLGGAGMGGGGDPLPRLSFYSTPSPFL